MKKTLLVLGAIAVLSTATYSFRGYSYGSCPFGGDRMGRNSGYHMDSNGMGRNNGYHMNRGGYNNLSPEEQQKFLEAREKNSEIYNKYSLDIQQKRLDVERELLNEKPDWKKIEKLNGDIAELEAKARTEMMKNSY